MKVKMKAHNGAIALVVSGASQELIIVEENGGFVIEMMNITAPKVEEEESHAVEGSPAVGSETPVVEVERYINEETPAVDVQNCVGGQENAEKSPP